VSGALSQFTQREAVLCFVNSILFEADEFNVPMQQRLSFHDFLEVT
jgi:hypothetical protein